VSSLSGSRLPPAELMEKARKVRLLLTDCDGVLTDASVYYSSRGEEWRRFSVRDGMGVERLRQLARIETGIISRENSGSLVQRAAKLAIRELHVGIAHKLGAVHRIASRRQLELEQIAYIGDDVIDEEALSIVGFSAAPADAEPQVRSIVDYVCENGGGHGAFREVAEFLISAARILD
jgi:3-deoxy-D-manno-octulosonate 8-phosphate phosphatase (KDO 8-P phosphatase)